MSVGVARKLMERLEKQVREIRRETFDKLQEAGKKCDLQNCPTIRISALEFNHYLNGKAQEIANIFSEMLDYICRKQEEI